MIGPDEPVVVVRGRPRAGPGDVDGDRPVVVDVVGRGAKIESGGIDEGFERRSGLPQRLRRAVERERRADVAPADHGTHRAVGGHHDDGALRLGFPAHILAENVQQRVFRRRLDARIERGADDHVLGRVLGEEIGAGFHDVIGEIAAGRLGGRGGQGGGVGQRIGGGGGGEVLLFFHQADDDCRTVLRALQVRCGGQRRGRLEQPGKHRGLRRAHLRRRDAEIALRRGLEPARACAEVGAVEVDGEDLLLGIGHLHRHREDHFLHLAPQGRAAAVGLVLGLVLPLAGDVGSAKAQQFRGLLGDRRAAVARQRSASLAQVDADRGRDALRIDARMPVKAPVFGGDDGVAQVFGHGLRRDHPAVLVAAPGEGLAVPVEQRDRASGTAIHQILDRGQFRCVIQHAARKDDAGDEGKTPADAPDRAEYAAHKGGKQAKDAPATWARGLFAAPCPGGGFRRRFRLCRPATIAPVGHQRCAFLSRTAHIGLMSCNSLIPGG